MGVSSHQGGNAKHGQDVEAKAFDRPEWRIWPPQSMAANVNAMACSSITLLENHHEITPFPTTFSHVPKQE